MQRSTDSTNDSSSPNRFVRRDSPHVQETGHRADASSRPNLSKGSSSRPKPMRQFDYAVGEKPPSALARKMRIFFYWVVPPVAFLGVIAAGLAVSLHLWVEDVGSEEQRETQKAVSWNERPVEVKEPVVVPEVRRVAADFAQNPSLLRTAYLRAFGGVEAMRTISSMRTSGTFVADGRSLDFQAIKKTPDMGAFSLEADGVREGRYVINGVAAWEVVQESAGRSAKSLSHLQRDVVALASQIFDPVAEVALGLGGRIENVVEVSREGRNVLLVEVEQRDGAIVRCLLDRSSLHLLVEERNVLREGHLMTKAIRYSDYRESEGAVRPHRLSLLYDGELQSEIVIDSMRINPGVMSSLFAVPDDLSI